MAHRLWHRTMLRRADAATGRVALVPVVLAIASCWLCGSTPAHASLASLPREHAPIAQDRAPASEPPIAAPQAWWQGFGEPMLDRLVTAARVRHPEASAMVELGGETLVLGVEMQVAATYVTARVDNLSLFYIHEAQLTQQRARTLVRGDDAAARAQRLAAAAATRSITARRNAAVERLAFLSGLPIDSLIDLLAPAMKRTELPQFAPSTLATGELPMREDVARALADVDARSADAERLYTRAAAAQDRYDRLRERPHPDAAARLQTLEHYRLLMVDSQRLTQASGNLALMWIKLIARLDAGPVDIRHALGAPPSP